jgi:uncharacterized protein (DUF1501 family)
MSRRKFIKNMGFAMAGVPVMANGFSFGIIKDTLFNVPTNLEDRVLVIIKLNGGNDGLNTVIPLDQYDKLMLHRPNVIQPQNSIINISDTIGFHQNMSGMRNVFENGKLSIVQNVGYPNQNRSHFQSSDIWSTGIAGQNETNGWLGRNFDQNYPNYPDDYPNDTNKDPFAISMGNEVSATCQGLRGNFSVALEDPFEVINLLETDTESDNSYYGNHISFLSNTIAQSNAYGNRINIAANAGNTLSTLYTTSDLSKQLRFVAQMISGGLQTKVYVLSLDGFDTHNAQTINNNATQGKHAELLKELSEGIAAFQDDLRLLDLEKRVAGITFSEFGRQIKSNAGYGTDHGDAAPMFLFGSCISASVIGNNPDIPNAELDQEGVPMQIDFRDIYASVLKDWFGAPEQQIQGLFTHQVQFYPLFRGCDTVIGLEENNIILYPNPCKETLNIKLNTLEETVTIKIINLLGQSLGNFYQENVSIGLQNISINTSRLSLGTYILSVEKKSGNVSKKFIKTNN